MKYERLTKEQFEEMHQEFINFLAAQSITADEWDKIKKDKPELAEAEMDTFSDLVWEGVLSQVQFLENISKHHMYLFHIAETHMSLIGLKVLNDRADLTTRSGFDWLRNNMMSDDVELFQSDRPYSADKHKDVFELIRVGSVITKGDLFQYFMKLLG